MSGGKKFTLWVIAIFVIVIAYRTFTILNSSDKTDAAFLTIYNLTPNDLGQACGAPDRDLTGRLVEDDGIRDMHYLDSSGRRLVFRFLSDTRASSIWTSIGVWTNLAEPDGLGDAVGDADAVEHMSCLTKTRAARTASVTHGLPSGSLMTPAALMPLLAQGLLVRVTAQRGMEAPTPGSGYRPTPPPAPPIGNTLPLPPPLPPAPGMSAGESNGDHEPPGPKPPSPPSQIPIVIVPCVGFENTGKATCEMVGSLIFLRDLDDSLYVHGNMLTRLDNLATKLTGRDFRIIQLPALVADRAAVIKEIFQLEIKTVNLVSTQLKEDAARLSPMKWDSSEDKERKHEEVRNDENQRRDLWRQATEDSRPSHSMSSSDDSDGERGGRMHMNDNSALRQLVQVEATKGRGF